MSDQTDKVLGKFTEIQYLRWRLAVEKMHHDKSKHRMAQLAYQVGQLEITLAQSKLTTRRSEIDSAVGMVKRSEAELKTVRVALEGELGVNLDDCMINEDTFELLEIQTLAKEA